MKYYKFISLVHAQDFLFRFGRRKPLSFYALLGGTTCILAGVLSKDTGIRKTFIAKKLLMCNGSKKIIKKKVLPEINQNKF